jgi:hypothetical protein
MPFVIIGSRVDSERSSGILMHDVFQGAERRESRV